MHQRGHFITLEGGEGVGKTTLARALSEHLARLGIESVLTREPGGCPSAERLRDVLYGPASPEWSPVSETLILYAARAAHLEETIVPALKRGAWVICDRFNDSTLVYQGILGKTEPTLLEALASAVIGANQPDLTFILDLDPAIARQRAEQRGEYMTRYDKSPPEFHEALREGFKQITLQFPERCILLDAALSAENVARSALAHLVRRRLMPTTDGPHNE